MASRRLDDLSARFKPFAIEFLARCVEANIPVKIIETRRTQQEHEANVANGVSWTSHSLHIDGDAIDVAPLEVLTFPNWDPTSPLWGRMATIALTLGITAGYYWQNHPDACHFEYKKPQYQFVPVVADDEPAKPSFWQRMLGGHTYGQVVD